MHIVKTLVFAAPPHDTVPLQALFILFSCSHLCVHHFKPFSLTSLHTLLALKWKLITQEYFPWRAARNTRNGAFGTTLGASEFQGPNSHLWLEGEASQ